MKKINLIMLLLTVLLCGMVTGCSKEEALVLDDVIPDNITSVEISGFYGGSELKLRELTQEEIEELNTWVSELSLEHRTYAKGEAPNEAWSGGTSYRFNINDGKMSFSWINIDKTYILYDNEWYEITNTSNPPLGLSM